MESEKEKDKFYEMKVCEMERFKGRVETRVSELRQQVLDMRINIDEVMSFNFSVILISFRIF